MHRTFIALSVFFFSSFITAQTPVVTTQDTPPQTARQALIEMFFGAAPNHLERHLPDITRKSFLRMNSSEGRSLLADLSSLSNQAKSSGAKIETFDTGPTILTIDDENANERQRVEVTVERDDLAGDEDEIEVALHLPQEAREQTLPITPHLTFTMTTEADVWRLTDVTVTVRLPLGDPDFLKGIEDNQRRKNEQMVMWAMRQVNTAEQAYSAAQGRFACRLATLASPGKQSGQAYLYDPQLASGNKNGYVFVISECDGMHYQVVAEPAVPDSGGRAFCSDESGAVRASDDGKAATCLSSGETVMEAMPDAVLVAGAGSPAATAQPASPAPEAETKAVAAKPAAAGPTGPQKATAPERVRVSQGVMHGLLVKRVAPIYPQGTKVQGSVVLHAVIGKDGAVEQLNVASSASPLLNQAAVDAVKQWKYRPFLLNGKPVEVDTQITVNFTLSRP